MFVVSPQELEEALLTDGADDTGSCLLQELMVRLLAGCLGHSPNNTDISPFNYQMFLRRLFRQKCQVWLYKTCTIELESHVSLLVGLVCMTDTNYYCRTCKPSCPLKLIVIANCNTHNFQELNRDNPFNTDIDFQFLPLRTKVEILYTLCDFRLDADDVQEVLKVIKIIVIYQCRVYL